MIERYRLLIDDEDNGYIIDYDVEERCIKDTIGIYEIIGMEKIVELLNKQDRFIQDILYQLEYNNMNIHKCGGCVCYVDNIEYCTMYDMLETKPEDIVIGCTQFEEKREK